MRSPPPSRPGTTASRGKNEPQSKGGSSTNTHATGMSAQRQIDHPSSRLIFENPPPEFTPATMSKYPPTSPPPPASATFPGTHGPPPPPNFHRPNNHGRMTVALFSNEKKKGKRHHKFGKSVPLSVIAISSSQKEKGEATGELLSEKNSRSCRTPTACPKKDFFRANSPP